MKQETKKIRVYCDGIFDLFHFGHAQAFEQAKKSYPNVHLIVGVMSDKDTIKNKGPIVMTQDERAISVGHCKWVDQVIKCPPWVIDQEFLDEYKIDFVAHDDLSYPTGSPNDVHRFVKDQGKFMTTKRTRDISTSDLITRIIKNYDMYIDRNLKRGVNNKDLNISLFKKIKLFFSSISQE
jgi:choline-phosphate cytidylyltransferase